MSAIQQLAYYGYQLKDALNNKLITRKSESDKSVKPRTLEYVISGILLVDSSSAAAQGLDKLFDGNPYFALTYCALSAGSLGLFALWYKTRLCRNQKKSEEKDE